MELEEAPFGASRRQSAAAVAVGVAVAAAVVVTTAAAEGTAATPQHDDDQKDDPDPAAAVGRAKHMLVPFPAPEISAPRLRGNRRAGVGGLTGFFPQLSAYTMYTIRRM